MARPGNSTHSTKVKPTVATPFAIRRHQGRWQVQHGTNWLWAHEISLIAPAIFLPSGEICGMGVVTKHGNVFTVTS